MRIKHHWRCQQDEKSTQKEQPPSAIRKLSGRSLDVHVLLVVVLDMSIRCCKLLPHCTGRSPPHPLAYSLFSKTTGFFLVCSKLIVQLKCKPNAAFITRDVANEQLCASSPFLIQTFKCQKNSIACHLHLTQGWHCIRYFLSTVNCSGILYFS